MQYILILSIIFNCTLLIAFTAYFMKQQHLNCLTDEKACINEERYALLLEQTRDVVFEWNIQTKEIVLSKTFEKRFGYELSSDNFPDSMYRSGVIFEEDIEAVKQMLSSLVSAERFTFTEARICDSDKKFHWCKISATSIRDKAGKTCRVIGLISNIEEHKMQVQQAEERANTDSLTTIYNKGATEVLINEYLEGEPSTSIMLMIDVDNFKTINDTLGHSMGDLALKNIGKGLKSLFRTRDIVGRIGGDEFIVFLTDVPNHFAIETKAKEIFSVVTNALSQTEIHTEVTCSIGAATYPRDGVKYYELYEKADTALYFSKAHGKNKLSLYNSNMLAKSGLCACQPLYASNSNDSPSSEELKNLLEKELASNRFEVYLQPKVPLAKNFSIQAEALIRYHHPEKGLLSPGQFVPYLEERQLIYLIDLFVLKFVAKQLLERYHRSAEGKHPKVIE